MAIDIDDKEERAAYVALALTPGIGAMRMAALLGHCHTASGALAAPFAFLSTIPGISPAAASAIAERTPADGERILAEVSRLGGRSIVPDDADFPPVLREIPDPPTLLFAMGEVALLGRPAAAIVGSRDHSEYGSLVGREVAEAAARAGVVVVSGMARGLDAIAHLAALDAGGATIGVLGNGLGVVYPAANRALYRRVAEQGLLLTEFPPGERPGIGAFPRRNRLISALARVTVVVEAAEGSGTLITVGTALAQGRDVMAIPGNITSPTSLGTNRLIRDGAEPLLEVADLLAHFPECEHSKTQAHGSATRRPGGSAKACPTPPEDLTPLERGIFEILRGGHTALDAVVAQCGNTPSEALVAISTLELRGLLIHSNGQVGLSSLMT